MAMSSAMVGNVQPTVGSDNNGGFFHAGASGTDYSAASTPHYALTGIASAGAGNVILYASASADMVGNALNVVSGTNYHTGIFEITAVSVGVSITVGTNAAGQSISTGVGASGVMNIGGTLATVAAAVAAASPSNIINVKASGTYTVTTTLSIAFQSYVAPGNPFTISGYTTTPGDGGKFTWTTATNSVDLVDLSPSSTAAINVLLQNISFTTTAGTKADAINSKGSSTNSCNVTVINCEINGFVVGIEGNSVSTGAFLGLQVINSRVTSCSSHGVRNGASTYFLGSMIDNNGGDGFNATTGPFPVNNCCWFFERSIFYKNGANNINFPFDNTPSGTIFQYVVVSHCDISTATGAGILMESSTCPLLQISNSILDANGTYGIDGASTSLTVAALLYSNAFYNNSTAATRGFNAGIGTVTLSASPYNTIGSDFSLNSTAGGGAACKAAGWPGVMPGGTGYSDIGALQSSGGSVTNVQVIAPTQIRRVFR